MVNLGQLDVEISHEVAQEYYDYRQAMEKRYRLKTQGQFDRQMKIALRAHEVGMTPDELIMWTMDQSWVGINISYTKQKLSQMMNAEISTIRGYDNERAVRSSARQPESFADKQKRQAQSVMEGYFKPCDS